MHYQTRQMGTSAAIKRFSLCMILGSYLGLEAFVGRFLARRRVALGGNGVVRKHRRRFPVQRSIQATKASA